jgi:hypothetical protein
VARTEQNRQKKLAKKKAKEKAKRKRVASERNALSSLAGQIAAAQKFPLTCYLHGEVESSICSVLAARRLPDNRVIYACFLVDSDCLGIKDSFLRAVFPAELTDALDRFRETDQPLRRIEPAYAKKLILDAEHFCSRWGFHPRGDYKRAIMLLQDVDESQCSETFNFGREDKPHYIQGPNDSREFVEQVLATLRRNLGEGNYDFTVIFDEPEFGGLDVISDNAETRRLVPRE